MVEHLRCSGHFWVVACFKHSRTALHLTLAHRGVTFFTFVFGRVLMTLRKTSLLFTADLRQLTIMWQHQYTILIPEHVVMRLRIREELLG